MKILLADDTGMVLRLTTALLEHRDHNVKSVTDGDEVIEFLDSFPAPDLVITDYNMPRMDGLEVLRHIRADERFRTLPVIVYTASDLAELRVEVEALGGVVVNKMPKELLVAIDEIAVNIAKERG